MFFRYDGVEVDYLKMRDKRLAEVIDEVGLVCRKVQPNLFEALVNSIVGQQISTKAQVTIFSRMQENLGAITPENLGALSLEEIQRCGISMRKAGYIRDAALRIQDGELDLDALRNLPDEEVCNRLCTLKGVGVWTAEMLMLFSMQRKNILSFDDLAIHRGMRMIYRKREISHRQFEIYRKRYAPYGSVASLYLWSVASGAYGHTDPAKKGT